MPETENSEALEVTGEWPPLCDGDLKVLVNDFFRCQECENFDLCSDCLLFADELHPSSHHFVAAKYVSTGHRNGGTPFHDQAGIAPSVALENILRAAATQLESGSGRRSFSYSPLPDSRTWVRVLTILPGEKSARLHGQLKSVPMNELGKCAKYEALSYYWGRSTSFESIRYIYLDERPLPICENVFDAMEKLRFENRPRDLWIDAVCINQVDYVERSHQVQQMHLIYASASRTVVWLGKADDTSDAAMRLTQRSGSGNQPAQSPDEIGELEWQALIKLLDREWFSRTWCLQEMVLNSSDPLVMCGDKSFNWETFANYVGPKNESESLPLPLTNSQTARLKAYGKTRAFAMLRREKQERRVTHLLSGLLANSEGLRCTSPHDKVYAILGLARETDRTEIIPDYTKSILEVYTETMIHCLKHDRVINLLSCHTNSVQPASTDPITMLPSWVSDWRQERPLTALTSRPATTYRAGGSPESSHVHVGSEPGLLSVHVFFVDQVAIATGCLQKPKNFAELLQTIQMLEQGLKFQLAEIQKAYTEETDPIHTLIRERALRLSPDPRDSDAFWRTLIGDVYAGGSGVHLANDMVFPAPPHFAEIYEVLRYHYVDREAPEAETSKKVQTDLDTDPKRPQAATRATIPADFLPDEDDLQRWLKFTAPFFQTMSVLWGRQFFVTNTGMMGFGGGSDSRGNLLEQGDFVGVLPGASWPFLFREGRDQNERTLFRLVSEAYVHGIMQGEWMRQMESLSENVRSQLERTIWLC